jgi:hypothetical protein
MAKKATKLASRQTAYLLWFEFLKLAVKSDKKNIRTALLQSGSFYASWDIQKAKEFRTWWKDHGHLFEERYFVRRLQDGEAPLDKEALIVEIPLTQSATKLTKSVSLLISEALSDKRSLSKKHKGKTTATYAVSDQSEPKLAALNDTLFIYRDVYLKNRSLRGMKLLEAINHFYATRTKRVDNKIPSQFLYKKGNEESVRRALRNARRYIQRADKIILNVAKGEFPGRY